MAIHSSVLAWRISMDRRAWWAKVHGSQRVRHNLVNKQQALGRGDRDHLHAKCNILVDFRSLSVIAFGYQVKNHILHLAFFLGFIEASFVSSSFAFLLASLPNRNLALEPQVIPFIMLCQKTIENCLTMGKKLRL